MPAITYERGDAPGEMVPVSVAKPLPVTTSTDKAFGFFDDGTESGRVRVEIASGNLVAMPFRRGGYQLGGAASASFVASDFTYISDNDDGTQTSLEVSVSGGVPASAAGGWLRHTFEGNTYGPRFSRSSDYVNPISVLIDGVAYPLDTTALDFSTPQFEVTGINWNLYRQVVARDLGYGKHVAELLFPAGSSTRKWAMFGYVVDAREGYVPPARGVNFYEGGNNSTTLTVAGSWTTFPSSSLKTIGWRKMFFTNPGASAATVSIRSSSGTSTVWSKSVAVGDTVEFDPGGVCYHNVQALTSLDGVIATCVGYN